MSQPSSKSPSKSPEGALAGLWDLAKTIALAGLIALGPRIVLAQPNVIPSASMEPTLRAGDEILVSKFPYGWSRFSVPFSPPLGAGRLFPHPPQRGDVVVFNLPRDTSELYVKRLIGLPGDRISVRGGRLLINGAPAGRRALGVAPVTCPQSQDERLIVPIYAEQLPGGREHVSAACLAGVGGANDTAEYRVPKNCFFVLGDNRDNSLDSRFPPSVGPTREAALAACPFDPALEASLSDVEPGVGFVPFDNLVGRADLILASWSKDASFLRPWMFLTTLDLSRVFKKIT